MRRGRAAGAVLREAKLGRERRAAQEDKGTQAGKFSKTSANLYETTERTMTERF